MIHVKNLNFCNAKNTHRNDEFCMHVRYLHFFRRTVRFSLMIFLNGLKSPKFISKVLPKAPLLASASNPAPSGVVHQRFWSKRIEEWS